MSLLRKQALKALCFQVCALSVRDSVCLSVVLSQLRLCDVNLWRVGTGGSIQIDGLPSSFMSLKA